MELVFRRLFSSPSLWVRVVFSLIGVHREDGTLITRIRDDGITDSFRNVGYQHHIDTASHRRLRCEPICLSTVNTYGLKGVGGLLVDFLIVHLSV
jgi:hypothetical protein